MFILARNVYGDYIKEVDMGCRIEKQWGRKMYRENYI
jgi:hypothetical protein